MECPTPPPQKIINWNDHFDSPPSKTRLQVGRITHDVARQAPSANFASSDRLSSIMHTRGGDDRFHSVWRHVLRGAQAIQTRRIRWGKGGRRGKKKKGDRGASLTYVWWAAINRRPLIGPAGLMKQSCRPLNRDQLGEQEESRTGWHLHYHIWQKWILVSSAGYKIHNEYCWVLFLGVPYCVQQ